MTIRTATVEDFNSIQSSARRAVKKDQVIYWTTTGIVFGIMLWSAINFAFNPAMADAFTHLGLPNWFRMELTTAKFLGALALLIPAVPHRIKEIAYVGFGITLISASVAHLSSGDPFYYAIAHSAVLASLVVSYSYYHKRVRGTVAF